jgi:hypothetical protein
MPVGIYKFLTALYYIHMFNNENQMTEAIGLRVHNVL